MMLITAKSPKAKISKVFYLHYKANLHSAVCKKFEFIVAIF